MNKNYIEKKKLIKNFIKIYTKKKGVKNNKKLKSFENIHIK